ncbi:cupin domain-containing protein [Legionella sp. D16C41]|uniref:cupin domain-containing protein n=1 Tax=Legionella sp. D16C41 TaxID=3402688 RepID=UPI003AF6A390
MSNTIKLNLGKKEMLAKGVFLNEICLDKSIPFNASYFEVQPGCQTPLDYHEEQEIWIILRGHGTLHYNQIISPLKENDIIYFDSYVNHQVFNQSSEILMIYSFYWLNKR